MRLYNVYGPLNYAMTEYRIILLTANFSICVELWIDDVSRWPPIEFPHAYTYLIDTPGEFTREKLKAFKSLQAYNY